MNNMKIIKVNLKDRSYPIIIGADLAQSGELLKKILKIRVQARRVLIVTNKLVAGLYLASVENSLKKSGFLVSSAIILDGESYKTLKTVKKLYASAVENGLDRTSLVVALGGGVVGDITGFFAATYMRGIEIVQIPTTLLAMVDSSIGGKTGVDLKEGKNLVGAFHQPKAVLIDTKVLTTLPLRQLRNGMAEVIKYSLLENGNLFDFLQKNVDLECVFKDRVLEKIIFECASIKARIVSADEYEKTGLRQKLNLGHTFAHTIETVCGYKGLLHGEAVAFGIILACHLSMLLGTFKNNDFKAVRSLILGFGLPVEISKKVEADDYITVMGRDKKSVLGAIKFVLPQKIGNVLTGVEVNKNKIKEVLK
ncbi:MAG: 3-dehydroquinate synthase [Endomicrobiales bacterium]|nr:3-dehydroquinate synthase [Endomicrobiales bacterium]